MEAPKISTVIQVTTYVPSVPVNIFTGTLQDILGFTNTQVRVLVDYGYGSQEPGQYCKFTDIQEWCELKAKIHTSLSGISYVYSKIKCLQVLSWWVTDLTLQGKIIDLNKFKTDILSGAIEESWVDFEYTRDVKDNLSNPKELSHEKWTQWEDSICN